VVFAGFTMRLRRPGTGWRVAEDSDLGPLRLALLGDSIAYGVGADRTEHTLAPWLRAELDAAGFETISHVFAWSGARSADLPRQVERALRWRPDVAVLIVGANDLTHQVPPAEA
jgi:lysophospholipase L1-like esterase